MTLLITFGSIGAYLGIGTLFARRFAWNFANLSNSYSCGARWRRDLDGIPSGGQILGAVMMASIWPLTFWYAFHGPDSNFGIAPGSVRKQRKLQGAENRVRELERQLDIAAQN